MALIECPECRKEVSDKAACCPHCGNPLVKQQQTVEVISEPELTFPTLPADLKIGKTISNINHDAYFKGTYIRPVDAVIDFPSGEVSISLHTHGLSLWKGFKNVEINNAQIIGMDVITRGELVADSRSVIGRAVVGSLLAGGIGAVIGGMTAMNASSKIKDTTHLVINYWDLKTKKPQAIILEVEQKQIKKFIARHNKEIQLNITKGRVAKKEGVPGIMIFCLIVIAFIAALFIFF